MIAQSPVPVLVDFYATWCGPCQLLSKQVFPQLAAAVGRDKVSALVKIDTEKYPNIASKFGVEALPTIILFKDGEILDRIEGLRTRTNSETGSCTCWAARGGRRRELVSDSDACLV